ncbi:MAG: AAA family ATPase [Bacteroidaceae bacterium]|nr:AAA family ATPase [Bacteroidaceae bacterium]
MPLNQEIQEICTAPLKIKVRYTKLYSLLQRVCLAETEHLSTDFSGLFARLYFVCKQKNIPLEQIDKFRRNALLILRGKKEADEQQLTNDAHDLQQFIIALHEPKQKDGTTEHHSTPHAMANISVARGVVTEINEHTFTLKLQDQSDEVCISTDDNTLAILHEGAVVNVVEHGNLVVLEPDFLIDVSALTACLKPYGHSPYNYLLSKLQPRATSKEILLGNAANQFMDDCVNTKDATFTKSMQKHFRQSLLDYACFENENEIDARYFAEAEQQFQNIYKTVHQAYPSKEVGIALDHVLLEPSFICPTLGLRARLDVMTDDHLRIVELKSGKADDFRPPIRSREEHLLQMALYKEILHYNFGLPINSISAFLFYSRYPILLADRISHEQMRGIMHLRNEIVHLEMRLREGKAKEVIDELRLEHIVTKEGLHPNFLKKVLPPIEKLINTIHSATPLEQSYFCHFLTFLSRELFLSKMGEPRPDSTRGFARVWNADLTSKLMSGEILINLKILEIIKNEVDNSAEEIVFEVPNYGEKFIADFSVGDMVQLYERNTTTDGVTNRQLVRGHIVTLTDTQLRLHLAYKQSNPYFFTPTSFYAIEKDSTDSGMNTAFRGLYGLLNATEARKALLLGQRTPTFNSEFKIYGTYTPIIENIVRAALSANDYYLLIGPPGTGKTNVALRSMVQEFLTQSCMAGERKDLLISAYTNRAVDEICLMLHAANIDFVRLGIEQTCAEAVRPNLFSVKTEHLKNRAEVKNFLEQTQIVVGTIATLSSHTELFNVKSFDLAIIDEASQVLEPQILPLLTHPRAVKRFVMIGDHKQLPAVVMQRTSQTVVKDEALINIGLTDLRNSLFERLHRFVEQAGITQQATGLLYQQGRMHSDIAQFVNHEFYNSQLQVIPLPHQEGSIIYNIEPQTEIERFVCNTRMGFVHVEAPTLVDNVKANRAEAEQVAQIVRAIQVLSQHEGTPLNLKEQLGVIVPFRNQISMVRSCLRAIGITEVDDISIDTVECYQGSQRDYIIFTTTISQPYQLSILSVEQKVGNSVVDRKLNVAITRARKQFFMVGNQHILRRSPLYERLIDGCKKY